MTMKDFMTVLEIFIKNRVPFELVAAPTPDGDIIPTIIIGDYEIEIELNE